jgi:hypothetical protein
VKNPFDPAKLNATIDKVHRAGMPGVFGKVRDGDQVWRGAASVADVAPAVPTPPTCDTALAASPRPSPSRQSCSRSRVVESGSTCRSVIACRGWCRENAATRWRPFTGWQCAIAETLRNQKQWADGVLNPVNADPNADLQRSPTPSHSVMPPAGEPTVLLRSRDFRVTPDRGQYITTGMACRKVSSDSCFNINWATSARETRGKNDLG